MAETAAEVKEGLRGGGVFETSEHGRVEGVEGDGEVKEAKAAEAGVWVNLPGFVTLERVGKSKLSEMMASREKGEIREEALERETGRNIVGNIPRRGCEQSPGLEESYCTPPRASARG